MEKVRKVTDSNINSNCAKSNGFSGDLELHVVLSHLSQLLFKEMTHKNNLKNIYIYNSVHTDEHLWKKDFLKKEKSATGFY